MDLHKRYLCGTPSCQRAIAALGEPRQVGIKIEFSRAAHTATSAPRTNVPSRLGAWSSKDQRTAERPSRGRGTQAQFTERGYCARRGAGTPRPRSKAPSEPARPASWSPSREDEARSPSLLPVSLGASNWPSSVHPASRALGRGLPWSGAARTRGFARGVSDCISSCTQCGAQHSGAS